MSADPMFYVRLCSDGTYEGPIHASRIERVRVESGAWQPLYLAAAPAAPAAESPEPLTDEQVFANEDFMSANGLYWGLPMTTIMQIVRCTERAHGIGAPHD